MTSIKLSRSESDISQLKLLIDKCMNFASKLSLGQIKVHIKIYLPNCFIIFLKDNLNNFKILSLSNINVHILWETLKKFTH